MARLTREDPTRTAEIEALQSHVDKLTAEAEADAEEANARAVIGGNNPPEDTPAPVLKGRSAIDAHVTDLLTEAANWGDGVAVVDQAQADAVGRLHRMLQDAASLVDDAASKEKKPHNDAIAEIGTSAERLYREGAKEDS